MAVPKAFKNFNVKDATVSLWLFRKNSRGAGQPPSYVGRWVGTSAELDSKIKEAIVAERARITELQEYSLTAQTNEGSALAIDALLTNAGLIAQQAKAELPKRRAKEMKEIQNTNFYAVKLTHAGEVMYAVRKAEASWKTKKMRDVIYVFLSGTRLALDDKPSFMISPYIDFFIFDDQVFISNKGNFESILNYKAAHKEDFQKLQADPAFTALFTTVDPIVTFVGDNKLHLRRACAVHDKGYYKDKKFMSRLRKEHSAYKLKLQFDAQGRIVPTEETCGDIIRALLDHRLRSAFSENLYDVDNVAVVK